MARTLARPRSDSHRQVTALNISYLYPYPYPSSDIRQPRELNRSNQAGRALLLVAGPPHPAPGRQI